jgi:hypothetical protein
MATATIATIATALVKLTNHMVPAISSSEVANITHFKNRQVSLPHSVQNLLLANTKLQGLVN